MGAHARLHTRLAKSPLETLHHTCPMDTEQINLIGSLLADLSKRTEQLRGYL